MNDTHRMMKTSIEVVRLREKSNESAEMYLETILILSEKLPVVRSVDVANELDFKKSSVSIAMKNLREKNQITMTDAGYIYLTEEGRSIAEMILELQKIWIWYWSLRRRQKNLRKGSGSLYKKENIEIVPEATENLR